MWERIEQAMMKKGIKPTVKEFQRVTGLSYQVVEKIKRNQTNMSWATLRTIEECFDVSIVDIFYGYGKEVSDVTDRQ